RAILDDRSIPIALESEKLAASLLAAPGKIATSAKQVAISDTLHHRIILADHQGNIEKIIGGPESGSVDGDANSSRFNSPQGVIFSEQGLYIADTGNHLIRYLDLESGKVSRIAGNGELQRLPEGNYHALKIGLASPWGLALEGDMLYIAMAGSHQIWRYNTKTKRASPYAGSGREGIDNGALPVATFSQPSGLSIVGDWLYVADAEDSAIRRIHLKKGQVETLIGRGLFDFGDRDGAFDQAQLQHVLGVVAYGSDQLLIADTYNHKLKSMDLQQGSIRTLLGTGKPGSGSEPPSALQLNEPSGLAIIGDQVLITDTNHHRIIAYDLKNGHAAEWKLRLDSKSYVTEPQSELPPTR
ncbi:MAG: thiol-disulfide isomerase, partial [Gammaproteobacteria bacterium]|nr:thiol-disulfide isomerase [Gammaproteobacteria bacterium]